ncbi:MAG TPA: leucyl aminopeptidase family protein [Rhodanobacteraceae bacterium]|nr:leucyl aminopeptidase family protein [Rhodanobacteraceae bacterium]
MLGLSADRRARRAVPLTPVTRNGWSAFEKSLGARQQRWLRANGFVGQARTFCMLPDAHGDASRVVCGVDPASPTFALGAFPYHLPAADYRLDGGELSAHDAALGWALGSGRFARYRKPHTEPARLLVPRAALDEVAPTVDAITRVRDLINTPAQDLGPAEMCAEVREVAARFGAKCREWSGDALLKAGFPSVHAVGCSSPRTPRVIELRWGNPEHPLLALVGKGVCFDTGGLDLKNHDGMRWMKKDMGGAAHALSLAQLVMASNLPVRLLLLIPTVDNAVAGDAMRPGDVIRTRAGITVEIDNTDAEGRLILCDALAAAAEEKPDLLIDFATLTGSARVALGPDLPALFANRDDVADALLAAGAAQHDPLWRLPLWQPYRAMLASAIADTCNNGASRHAGAITAALYLQSFVPATVPWLHLDVYAWNDFDRPGRPRGGDAQSLRAFQAFLRERYARG